MTTEHGPPVSLAPTSPYLHLRCGLHKANKHMIGPGEVSANSVLQVSWELTWDNGSIALDSVFSWGVFEVESRKELPMTERLEFRASCRL